MRLDLEARMVLLQGFVLLCMVHPELFIFYLFYFTFHESVSLSKRQ